MQIELSHTVAAQPADAFAVVVNVHDWPQIIRSIKKVEVLTPGPLRRGSRLREDRIMFGRTAAQELEIETDARLEGYPDKMALDPANNAMTWAAFGFLAAVTLLGLFKDAKRSHLD